MKRMVDGILRQYGSSLELRQEGNCRTVKGFLQPVRSKSWQNMVNLTTPLGEVLRGQYIYIGPSDVPVREGDLICLAGKEFFLRKISQYFYADQAVYTWGLCVQRGVNDTWGLESSIVS